MYGKHLRSLLKRLMTNIFEEAQDSILPKEKNGHEFG